MVKAQSHRAIAGGEDLRSQLHGARQQVVGHRVAAEKGFAVVGRIRQAVGPVIVGLRCGSKAFDGGKVVIRGAGSGGELVPLRLVEDQNLHGFGDGEDLDALAEAALVDVPVHVGGDLLLGQIVAQVHQRVHLVNGIRGVRVRGENVGRFFSVGRAAHRILHHLGQIVHIALAVALHPDAQLLAGGGVELINQRVEGCQQVPAVIVPKCNGDRILRVQRAAVGRRLLRSAAAEKQGAQAEDGQDTGQTFLHE